MVGGVCQSALPSELRGGGCAAVSWRVSPPRFNAALTRLGHLAILSANVDLPLRRKRKFSCRSEHSIRLWAQPCAGTRPSHPSGPSNTSSFPRPSQGSEEAHCTDPSVASGIGNCSALVGEVRSALPGRPCQDVLNFRGNGPEDARLLPLGESTALVVYNDYAPKPAGGPLSFRRTIYVSELSVSWRESRIVGQLGRPVRLSGAQTSFALGDIEKNWSPFSRDVKGRMQTFVHRWIDRAGQAIVHQLDVRSGELRGDIVSSNGKLRQVVGGPPHTTLSGGTPAVRLNKSHFVAIGHTMTMPCELPTVAAKGPDAKLQCLKRNQWRAYALFGYLFESEPPFRLVAATPQFRIVPPTGTRNRACNFGPPPPEVTRPSGTVYGLLGKPQFPVGLVLHATVQDM
ncbi:MAG: hypothetical protein SGPRY_008960 [Prymnesium sp.]